MMGLGMVGCIGQLTGMYAAIYLVWDWNTVEPWTWMFQSFYLMVGSWFYTFYKADWAYTSLYDFMWKRNELKIAKQQGFDMKKSAALKAHIDHMEKCLMLFNKKK